MIARVGPVTAVSATGAVGSAKVYRPDQIPKVETNGLTVLAARVSLPQTVGATVRTGTWLNGMTSRYPAAVLGADTADRLGIGRPSPQTEILVGGERFTLLGVLNPVTLAPELNTAVLIGWDIAADLFRFDGRATTVYTRSRVANTMVISVLERRAEIGLRRSLGATRGRIRVQFLAESLLLSALGGVGGVLLGIAVTTGYAAYQAWPSVVPPWATAGALAATVLIGGVAGLYPAIRAARLSPTEALATP